MIALYAMSACHKSPAQMDHQMMTLDRASARRQCKSLLLFRQLLLSYPFVALTQDIGKQSYFWFRLISSCYCADICYTTIRLLDLTATCGALRSFDDPARTSCVCSDAEEKISDGEITCGTDVCPEDCSLCQFCLYELLDCLPTTGTSIDEVARKAL